MEASSAAVVGVDVGGTKVAAGVLSADGRVVHQRRWPTDTTDAEAIVGNVGRAVRELRADLELPDTLPIGVGMAGLVDLDGVVRYAPNLPLRDVPLRALLERELGCPVTLDNDASAAAWAEFRVGAARDAPSGLVMLTLGTGVGGAVVLEGRLMRGAHGLAGELGHIVVVEGGRRCACGNRGDLEALASGTAIGRTAEELRVAGRLPPSSSLTDAEELSGRVVTDAALDGDAGGVAVLAEVGFWLGVGVASLVNALDPDLVLVGGGAATAGELLLGPARDAFADRFVGREWRTPVPLREAELGSDAGFIGAGLLALGGPGPLPG